nr:unnamed protein product [Digitaria exilis]
MASRSALIALLVVLSCAAAVSAATTFTVGDTSGWKTGVNYDNWVSGKTFAAGDQLLFNFATGSHDVVEVDKSSYGSCSISNAVNTIQTGPATVTLTSGTHYYICGIPGHCNAGMKLTVTVGSGSGGSPSSPSTPSTPGSPSSPPSSSTPAAPAPSAASASPAAPALAMAAGVLLLKLALF